MLLVCCEHGPVGFEMMNGFRRFYEPGKVGLASCMPACNTLDNLKIVVLDDRKTIFQAKKC